MTLNKQELDYKQVLSDIHDSYETRLADAYAKGYRDGSLAQGDEYKETQYSKGYKAGCRKAQEDLREEEDSIFLNGYIKGTQDAYRDLLDYVDTAYKKSLKEDK